MNKPPEEPTPAERRFGGSWRMIIPFALLPLLIVSACVGIFLLFGKLAENQLEPADYLHKLRSASPHKRWQAAYELSRYLSRPDSKLDRAAFEKELGEIYLAAPKDEALFRRYVIVALGQVGSERSLPLLHANLENDADGETKIYSLLALGRIGSPSSVEWVTRQLSSDDAGVRSAAAFALGFVGSRREIGTLRRSLEDPIPSVRWNAALALAQLGDDAGKPEILVLLDSDSLRKATPLLREPEREQIVLSAVHASAKLKMKDAEVPLRKVAETSAAPTLRLAAREALAVLATP